MAQFHYYQYDEADPVSPKAIFEIGKEHSEHRITLAAGDDVIVLTAQQLEDIHTQYENLMGRT